jgi:hypothetical protein
VRGGAPQLPGVGRVAWSRNLAFKPSCVDVNVYSVAVSQFQKEGETTFVSNIFIKAIENEPEGYSVVEVHVACDQLAHDQAMARF